MKIKKKIEFLKSSDWEIDFTEALKKIKEQENYDKIWNEIKLKMKW